MPTLLRIWKPFAIGCVSFSLALVPQQLAQGCGYYEPADDYFYHFYQPAQAKVPGYAAFFFTFADLADHKQDTKSENLAAWQAHAGPTAKIDDISSLVYNWPLDRTKMALHWVKGDPHGLRGHETANTFLTTLKGNKDVATLEYLVLAKEIEPLVGPSTYHWDAPTRDVAEMARLREVAATRSKEVKKNAFLQERYAFQAVRLAHYAGNEDRTKTLYQELVSPMGERSGVVRQWIEGDYAGALMYSGEVAEANRRFALLWAECPSKREEYYLSLHLPNQETWNASLEKCKTNEEKAALYALRAIDPRAFVLEEMREVKKLDPDSPLLRLLLAREVAKLENDLLGHKSYQWFNADTYMGFPREEAESYAAQLQAFAGECVKDSKVPNTKLWALAEGYLACLQGDAKGAESAWKAGKVDATDDPALRQQLDTFRWLSKVQNLGEVTIEQANDLYVELLGLVGWKPGDWNEPDELLYLRGALAVRFAAQGYELQAFLCRELGAEITIGPKADVVDKMINYLGRLEKSDLPFNKYLLDRSGGKWLFVELKGSLKLAEGDLSGAKKLFASLPAEYRLKSETFGLGYEPYKGRIMDCRHCSEYEEGDKEYTKLSLVEEMIQMEAKLKAGGPDAALNAYLLGNAWYNLSYFGSNHSAIDYYTTSQDWYSFQIKDETDTPLGQNREYVSPVIRGLAYYERAMILAKDNKELGARACYMAAKCERVKCYLSDDEPRGSWNTRDWNLEQNYRSYFEKLNEEYGETAYHGKVIEECRDFAYYIDRQSWDDY